MLVNQGTKIFRPRNNVQPVDVVGDRKHCPLFLKFESILTHTLISLSVEGNKYVTFVLIKPKTSFIRTIYK